jgi:hypothetical protein
VDRVDPGHALVADDARVLRPPVGVDVKHAHDRVERVAVVAQRLAQRPGDRRGDLVGGRAQADVRLVVLEVHVATEDPAAHRERDVELRRGLAALVGEGADEADLDGLLVARDALHVDVDDGADVARLGLGVGAERLADELLDLGRVGLARLVAGRLVARRVAASAADEDGDEQRGQDTDESLELHCSS